MAKHITKSQIDSRAYWLSEIKKVSGNFGVSSDRIQRELIDDIAKNGINALLGHLRLCGTIPENFGHDSTEEKLYSKYTDAVIAEAFAFLGIKCVVLTERADAADVSGDANGYSFVADAKAFRLARTAKNQKDFKVQAMEGWKGKRDYAVVVCPIYQFPSASSQIYQQAAARNVCLLSYTHLAVLVRYAADHGTVEAEALLHEIFKAVKKLENGGHGKSAKSYWNCVNSIFKNATNEVKKIWAEEKAATSESIELAKIESIEHIEAKDEGLNSLTLSQAIKLARKLFKFDSKIGTIKKVKDNGLLDL